MLFRFVGSLDLSMGMRERSELDERSEPPRLVGVGVKQSL